MIRVLVVDDESRIRSSLEGLLKDENYRVRSCGSAEEGLAILEEERYDVILLDIVLPGMDGIEMLQHIKKRDPRQKVLMMSGKADIVTAVRATKLGAFDFFEKPISPERVLLTLRNIADQTRLERKVVSLENRIDEQAEMVGQSEPMKQLKEAVRRASPSEGRVLIYGENGTGKELVANAIHRLSKRHGGPFVSLNCAAIPRDLVESELFGHEKGAFTGAVQSKPGRFELADGGTLFLDEIGDMGLETQAKLLRVLEQNETIRVGGHKPYAFDVRIVSATNKELKNEINDGRFRKDLFYRLNVIPLRVPPLRDRQEDIAPLAQHFLVRICEKMGKGMKQWGPGVLSLFAGYDWPGNVRELKNLVERLIIMSSGEIIETEDVATFLSGAPPAQRDLMDTETDAALSLRERLDQFERNILLRGFRDTGGNVSKLARRLKIDRANLHRKLKYYGIK